MNKRFFLPLTLILFGMVIICLAIYNLSSNQAKAINTTKVTDESTYIEQQSSTETITYNTSLGDSIGTLTIPALSQEMPVIEGTGFNELEVGVGHFVGSVMPGVEDNCVLSAHRDTFFSRLGELKIGDILIVNTSDGKFTYQIQGMKIVDKDDKTVIVPTELATLTLTTCYPFNYLGDAPDRYIVSAFLLTRE